MDPSKLLNEMEEFKFELVVLSPNATESLLVAPIKSVFHGFWLVIDNP